MIIKVVGIEDIDFTKDGERIQSKKIHYVRLDHGLRNVVGGIPDSFSISPRSQFFNFPVELGCEYVVFADQDACYKDKRVICHIAPVSD